MPASGLRGIHDIPLGSHHCTFYRQPKEFLRMSASFLKAGLINHEACVWILPSPVTLESAVHALSQHGLDSAELQATKQLQILSAHDCYFPSSLFDVDAGLNRLVSLCVMARQLGYRSVRAAGGPGPFLSEGRRRAFMRYEQYATTSVHRIMLRSIAPLFTGYRDLRHYEHTSEGLPSNTRRLGDCLSEHVTQATVLCSPVTK